MKNNTLSNELFYKKAIKEHGISPKGVHWNNKDSQYKRFEVLYKLIKKDIHDCVIVDAGCGFGEFYNFVLDKKQKPKKYIGIDCYDQMVDIAKTRFLNVEFFVLDVLNDELPQADYYIASGSLNILSKELFYDFIRKCYKASSKGFAFNFLKKRSFNNVKIDEVLAFCSSLSENIKTKNDYLDNDFTILMLKS